MKTVSRSRCRIAFQDAQCSYWKWRLKICFFFFTAEMKENIATMAQYIMENEEENSINASFHCSAVQQLFRSSLFLFRHTIANFYFNSLFHINRNVFQCWQLSNCEYLLLFWLIFFYITISLYNLIIFCQQKI